MSSYEPIDQSNPVGCVWWNKHWRQTAVGTVVFLLLLGFTLFVIFALPNKSDQQRLQIEDLFNSSFIPKSLSFKWLDSAAHPSSYTTLQTIDGSVRLLLHDAATQKNETLLDSKDLTIDGMHFTVSQPYTFSSNVAALLFAVNKTQIFRHSFKANYLVYTFATKTLKWVDGYSDPPKLTNAQWSPVTDNIAYVKEGNVWVQTTAGQTQVTNDGDEVVILNGLQNWVYEEEVFSTYNALWWSHDGNYVAFLKSNQSAVPTFSIPFYEDLAVNYMDIKYPKAGQQNPSVELWMHQINGNTTLVHNPLTEYITSVFWTNQVVLYTVLNRLQTHETTWIFDPKTSKYSNVTSKTSENGWVESRQDSFIINNSQLVHITNNTGFYHIALLTIAEGPSFGTVNFLTSGEWDVGHLLGYSPERGLIYFLGFKKSPTERHLYSVSLQGEMVNLTNVEEPGWFNAQFNSDCSFYFLDYQGPEVPTQSVVSTTQETKYLINDNQALAKLLQEFRIPTRTYFSTNESINGFTLRMDNPQTSPVLFSVYGGPGSQRVTKQWSLGFDEYLASNFNIAIITVDPVGTGGRGISFLQKTYLHLGKEETASLINSARWVQQNVPRVSPRMGIWGWSFGGFMTLSTITAKDSPLKFGVSVAPVTDWRLYDTFYTEKFMQTPQLNPDGLFRRLQTLNLL